MVDDDTLAFLMYESAKVNEAQDEWVARFGFRHECRCDQDYLEDNVGTVTECWANMADDALKTCEQQRKALMHIASGACEDPIAFAQEFTAGA